MQIGYDVIWWINKHALLLLANNYNLQSELAYATGFWKATTYTQGQIFRDM